MDAPTYISSAAKLNVTKHLHVYIISISLFIYVFIRLFMMKISVFVLQTANTMRTSLWNQQQLCFGYSTNRCQNEAKCVCAPYYSSHHFVLGVICIITDKSEYLVNAHTNSVMFRYCKTDMNLECNTSIVITKLLSLISLGSKFPKFTSLIC